MAKTPAPPRSIASYERGELEAEVESLRKRLNRTDNLISEIVDDIRKLLKLYDDDNL